jgi:glutamine synthetase
VQGLLDRLTSDEVRQLWVIYHDYSGLSHAKSIPPERFEAAIQSGVGFAKANMDFNVLDHQVPHPHFGADTGDFFAVPDPGSYALIPYHPGTARAYSFLNLADGSRWEGCPRAALQRVVERFETEGLQVQAAFEPECYLFTHADGEYAPADQSRMFTVAGLEYHSDLIQAIMETLPAMCVVLEQVGAEYGPAQYEVNVRHTAPLQAADNLNTLKEVMRALAARSNLVVSFMPKPFTDLPGCGLHVHLGLSDRSGTNVLAGSDASGLGDLGRSFVAGLLDHAAALSGVGAPTVNSYKRLLPGSWSPAHIAYGPGNRAALVRIPDFGAKHVEFRAGDNTTNPHLFLASLLAAGLDGIHRQLDPGDAVLEDIGHLSDEQEARRGLRFLPRSASEALDALDRDPVVMEALGTTIGPTFLRVKRSEIAAYDLEVTDWERVAYLTAT